MSVLLNNRLRLIESLGQSLWLDNIDRGLLVDGGLTHLMHDDGISGITSNPAIFEKAVAQHAEYDAAIALLARNNPGPQGIYEALLIEDICHAADLLHDIYETSFKRKYCWRDGYVSLEVSPHLAYDTTATVAEAKRLWQRVGRPNLMIKVPATPAGLPAIRQLVAAGINVNATLLFGVARYREVAESYFSGLEDRLANGGAIDHIDSVASFFLSRIDTFVDDFLDHDKRHEAQKLRGQTAIACARLAYREYQELVRSPRWLALAEHGACPQRLLWASTSTKNPAYDDVKYVEALIGPDTINSLPPETLAAYRDHGDPALRLKMQMKEARILPGQLAALGLELTAVSDELERQGVQKFIDSYERLLALLARRTNELTA